MKHIVVLSGAGISAESGLKTFRDENGLWEGHDVMAVASPEGFAENPRLVLEFYNQRRQQLKQVKPNAAHLALAKLERHFKVTIITQNVDDLHERAGSSTVLHLHGELLKARPITGPQNSIPWELDLNLGDTNNDNIQLRPDIVWFGEPVPLLEHAIEFCASADVLLIVGTSMQVYPAANLWQYAPEEAQIYYIDPKPSAVSNRIVVIKKPATLGVKDVIEHLKSN